MPIKKYVRTPLGEFASVAQASCAHKCDRATMMNRIKTRPEEYHQFEVEVEAKKKEIKAYAVRGVRWPISWVQYRLQDEDTKDAIYQAWCRRCGQDPDQEATAEAFFDDMEHQQDSAPDELEADLDDTA